MKNLFLVSLLPFCVCLMTMLRASFPERTPQNNRNKVETPEFEALMSISDAAEARAITNKTRSYRVVRITYKYEHCTVITEDGTHFTAVGGVVDKMRPGLVFRARLSPLSLEATTRTHHRGIWLVEPSN